MFTFPNVGENKKIKILQQLTDNQSVYLLHEPSTWAKFKKCNFSAISRFTKNLIVSMA